MIRRPPRSTLSSSSAASDVYKRQGSGVPGPGLTAAGRVHAAQAADLTFRIGRTLWDDLPHPGQLVASPMVRAKETAAAVGRRLGLPVEVEPAFAECDFGEWEG